MRRFQAIQSRSVNSAARRNFRGPFSPRRISSSAVIASASCQYRALENGPSLRNSRVLWTYGSHGWVTSATDGSGGGGLQLRRYATAAAESVGSSQNLDAVDVNMRPSGSDIRGLYTKSMGNRETVDQDLGDEEGLDVGDEGNIGSSYSKDNRDMRPPTQQDVFNYAARFNLLPNLDVHKLSTHNDKPKIRILIDLEPHNIKAVGTGKSFSAAQTEALLDFKIQANSYCEQNRSVSSLMSSSSLTTKNAPQFIKYYEIFHKANISHEIEPVHDFGKANQLFGSRVFIDGEAFSSSIVGIGKQATHACACLAAGIKLLAREPDLWPQFLKELEKGSGRIIRPVERVSFPIKEDCLYSMRDTIHSVRTAGLPDTVAPEQDTSVIAEYRKRRRFTPKGDAAARISKKLKKDLYTLRQDPQVVGIRAVTSELPANHHKEELIDMINENVYSIVAADTGSGKTTQVPQILFDHAIESDQGALCNIMVTQPRRIAATSVAQRVAAERKRKIGDTVGYHIRFECKAPQLTGGVTFSTTGVLLAQLRFAADEIFDTVSHIIVDEVHERSLDVDFLMITLKRHVEARLKANKPVPRIIFMSATIDVDLFANYFQNISPTGKLVPCPHVSIPGRIYPVEKHFLGDLFRTFSEEYPPHMFKPLFEEKMTSAYLQREARNRGALQTSTSGEYGQNGTPTIDWDNLHEPLIKGRQDAQDSLSHQLEDPLIPVGLAAATIAHICKTSDEGAILVFLPGYDSIDVLDWMLRVKAPLEVDFDDESKYKIIKLHSTVPAAQTEVFDPSPKGCRKIILSTNIAETSITIPDIRYVVDTGKVNEPLYDSGRRISKLACCWVSKSSSRQRAGRAGRVQNGNYYALFSKEKFDSLRTVGVPEILRLDLQEVCLKVKTGSFSSDIRGFLRESIEAPSAMQVDSSVKNLQDLEALDENEAITPLGRLLANIPLHPSLGKMIVLGIIFRCLEPMIFLGVCTGERDIFLRQDKDNRSRIREAIADFAGTSKSDHIAVLNALGAMRNALVDGGMDGLRSYASSKDLRGPVFHGIMRTAKQVEYILANAGLIPKPEPGSGRHSPFGGPQLNTNSSHQELVKALLLSGLFPNLAVKNNTTPSGWQTHREAAAIISSDSVNYTRLLKTGPKSRGDLLTFSSLREPTDGNILFFVKTSEVSPLVACLFGGRLRGTGSILRMDDWLPFKVRRVEANDDRHLAARIVVEFRKSLDRLLSASFQDLIKYDSAESSTLPRAPKGAIRRYLADDPVRETFAKGLVDLLSVYK